MKGPLANCAGVTNPYYVETVKGEENGTYGDWFYEE